MSPAVTFTCNGAIRADAPNLLYWQRAAGEFQLRFKIKISIRLLYPG